MSLINQMLRDLESRRHSDSDAQAVIAGIGDPSKRPPRRNRRLLLLLPTLTLALFVTALLLWREAPAPAQNVADTPPSTAESARTAELITTPDKPVADTAPREPPAAETPPPLLVKKAPAEPVADTTTSAPAENRNRAQPAETAASSVREQAPTPKAITVSERETESDNPSRVEKRIHPMTPAQLAEQHYQQGYQRLQQGNHKEAERLWQKALELDPAHLSSHEALSALYLSQSRRIEAAEQLQQGLLHEPGHGRLALLYARLRLENNDLDGALTVMERALQETPQTADFYAFIAALYQRRGDYADSIAAYQRALNEQPRRGVWWMGIAISLEGAGKHKEARTAYNEALDSANLTAQLRDYVEGRLRALQ